MTRAGIISRRKFSGSFGKNKELFRKRHRCAECGKIAVRKLAPGIWKCYSCGIKFAGKAYLPEFEPLKKGLEEIWG